MLDAAVASILDVGYYRTSSNEIARRAGVTWGTIQHQFGTREGLLLEVLNDRWGRLQEVVSAADASGDTLEQRLHVALDVLSTHYATPSHLAQLQILLDLTQNPDTSEETRKAAAVHGRQLMRAWQPLLGQALADAADEEDLVRYAFMAMRGYLLGILISQRLTPTRSDAHQRELLVRGVAASVRAEAATRGIVVH